MWYIDNKNRWESLNFFIQGDNDVDCYSEELWKIGNNSNSIHCLPLPQASVAPITHILFDLEWIDRQHGEEFVEISKMHVLLKRFLLAQRIVWRMNYLIDSGIECRGSLIHYLPLIHSVLMS